MAVSGGDEIRVRLTIQVMTKRLLILVALAGCGSDDGLVECEQGFGRCEPECSPFPAFDPDATCNARNDAAENGMTEVECQGVSIVDGRTGCCGVTFEGDSPREEIARWFECEGQ